MCLQRDRVSSSEQKRRYIAMVAMCQIAGTRDQLITLLQLLFENVTNIILFHFQDGSYLSDQGATVKLIAYSMKPVTEEDIPSLCGNLIPTLERLELLSEVKTGHNLKVFHRLVNSLEEISIQKLCL